MPQTHGKQSSGRRGAAALLLLLTALGLGYAALPAAPPEDERIEQVRPGMAPDQVRQLLGRPQRVARQILYHRYFEQWLYDAPLHLRVEFECRQGQEPQVQSVRSTRFARP